MRKGIRNKRRVDEICRQWIAGKMLEEMKQESRYRKNKDKPEICNKSVGCTAEEAECNLLYSIQEALSTKYEFRYNCITEQVEFRERKINISSEDSYIDIENQDNSAIEIKTNNDSKIQDKNNSDTKEFSLVNKRVLNTLCLELREAGIKCWDQDVQRYINSTRIKEYHPIKEYMDKLPEWDSVSRVKEIISRITKNDITYKAMFRWFLALASQWMGIRNGYGNSLCPILISSVQGVGKSTFCKNIVPDSLRMYYTDMFNLGSKGKMEQRLTQNCLINIDEMDRLNEKQMPLLKNLMQTENISMCKAYKSYFTNIPRIASFICTSNRSDLLTDPTGSRRFICIKIRTGIDNSAIEHKQLYAELKHYLEVCKERTWMTKEEESELQEHNKSFYRENDEMILFRRLFKAGTNENDEKTEWIKLSVIIDEMKMHDAYTMRKTSLETMGRLLVAAGVEKMHKRDGNYYLLERLK